MKYVTNLDLNQLELQNAKIQNLTTAPASPVKGQIYYNSSSNHFFIFDGTAWDQIDGQSGNVASLGVTAPITNAGTASNPVIGHATSGVTANTYKSVTVDVNGHVTGGTNPTTLAGFGIADAALATHNHTIDSLSNVTIASKATNDLLQWNGSAWVNKTIAGAGLQPAGAYLTGNQTVTLSGDATGSGATAIAVTLKNTGTPGVQSPKVTTDVQGRVISSAALIATDIPTLTHTYISDFDTQVRTSALNQMSVPTASVSMNSQSLTTLANPVNPQDAATKAYVDATASGLQVKQSVRVATTGSNITLSGTQTIDGIVVVAGDRVLVKDQTTSSQNGIYVVAAGAWSLATDANASTNIKAGMFTFVDLGTINIGTGWVLAIDPDVAITVGTTNMIFTQFSGAGDIITGTGLSKSGNTINMSASGVTAGTYSKITVDATGRATVGANIGSSDVTTALGFTPANAASSALTGTPTAPTASQNTNTTQLATTAFVLGQAGTANPLMDGTVSIGTSYLYSRQDHVHPIDTSRAPLNSPTFTGTVTLPYGTQSDGMLSSLNAAVPAAGTTQATATVLSKDINIVTSGTGGVQVQGATTGKIVVIVNNTASAINVYPSTGHYFDGLAINIPIVLNPYGFIEMYGYSSTQWMTTQNAEVQWSQILSKPTTVAGYGILDAMTTSSAANSITGFGASTQALGASAAGSSTLVSRADHVHAMPGLASLTDTTISAPASGNLLQYNGTKWVNWVPTYISGNQTITASGDATGSGTTAITLTLTSVGTAGTYTKVTTDSKGRVTAGTTLLASDIPAAVQAKRYALDVPAGTSVAITHSLGTTDVIVQVKEVATKNLIQPDITVTDANTVTLGFASNGTAGTYRVTVLA